MLQSALVAAASWRAFNSSCWGVSFETAREKLLWKGDEAQGYFICEDDLHCGAIWDGTKYLGIDEHWNWCKNCGMSFDEWDGDDSCMDESFGAESPQVGDEGLFWSRYNNRRVRIVGIEDNNGKTNAIGNPLGDVYFYRDLLDSGEADWRIHTDSEREFLSRFKPDKRAESFGAEHKAKLELIPYVDEVILFDEDTPYDLIKQLKPNLIVKGGDYTVEEIVGHDLAEVRLFPTIEGYSSSYTIGRINEDTSNGS